MDVHEYDLVILGAGSAGLTAADTAVLFGKKVALVTKERIGGDCLWTGCVPSKSLLHIARNCWIKGLQGEEAFQKAKSQIQSAQKCIVELHDSAEHYEKKGVSVFFGTASFQDSHTLQVGEVVLKSKFFLIATGSRPIVPAITGLENVKYLTNENVFEIEKLPSSLVVIGGGPIGCEIAQAFRHLGSEVHLIHRGSRLLPKDSPEASEIVLRQFEKEGIQIHLESETQSTVKSGEMLELVIKNKAGEEKKISGEQLLISIGRQPNVENLGLERIGVKAGKKGIIHNEELQTTQKHIYVAGDVAGDYIFTHYAARQAAAAVQNIMLPFDSDFEPRVVPWVTFTTPEVAHVGETEENLKEKRRNYRKVFFEFSKIDRAIAEGETEGFIQLLLDGDRILGAQVVGERAGEMIHEIALAIECTISVGKLMGMIHAYPTYSSGIQQALFDDFSTRESLKLKIGKFLAKFT